MKYLPQSLIGRALIVIFIGLIVAQTIAMALYSRDRSGVLALSGERHVADRISMLTKLAEDVPAYERTRMISKFRGRGMQAENAATPMIGEHIDSSEQTLMLEADLRQRLGDLPEDQVRVIYGDIKSQVEFKGMDEGIKGVQKLFIKPQQDFLPLLASIQLRDGSWLNVSVPITRDAPVWRSGYFIPVVMANLLIILCIAYLVTRLVSPLKLFAQAAQRLGTNVDAPPLEEQGPKEVRQAVNAFNQMQQQLQELVHGRTQMLAAISHDLRTPITRLRLRAEFINDADIQNKVLSDLTQMEQMLTTTLDFARDDAKVEEVCSLDLSVLLQSLCDEASDAGLAVTFQGQQHVICNGRPLSLTRALINLIDNAVKYGDLARVSVEQNSTHAIIRIEDEGPGIPEDQQDAVFKPFFRLESSRSRETGGTGLGLCVVRDIISAHGGSVDLDNRAEGGLSVTIGLPKH